MNVYEVITSRIVESLSRGVVPWRKPWACATPTNLVSGRAYRGVNVLLLHSSHFASPYWLTFNQTKARGGTVKRGERGTPVVFYTVRDDEKKDGTKRMACVLRYYTVFNLEQTEGVKSPPTVARPAFNPVAECERIVTAYHGRPEIHHGGGHACYIPSQDRILMPAREAFSSPSEYYSTLFHELAHSSGVAHRLSRPGVSEASSFGSHAYSAEELVAEITSAFLCGEAGISPQVLDNSAAYIAHWSQKLADNTRWIVKASADAARAADYILGKVARPDEGEPAEQAAA